MNEPTVNQKLKQLMLDYELGHMNYDTYRQRRNAIVDEYAGIDKRQPNPHCDKTAPSEPHRASTHRAIFTLGLVLLAVVIAYVAMTGEETPEQEQFVDSRILPDEPSKDSAP
jgi:hypothetical protein